MELISPNGPEDVLSLDSVRRLLSGGLTEKWRHDYGLSFFHLVAMSDNAAGVQFLLSQGWSPSVEVASSDVPMFVGMSPIHFAAFCGRTECLQALIQDKAFANQATRAGLRPLHFASIGNYDAAEILLVMGADPNAREVDGETPFIYSCGAANIDCFAPDNILELLIEKGADTTVVSKNKVNALHLAANAGNDGWTERFLEFGIDVNSTSSTGETPLHRAARFDHPLTCQILIKHGAKLDAKNSAGNTPLSLALEQSALDAAKVLLEHGATGAVTTPKAKPYGKLSIDLDLNYIGLEARRNSEAGNMVRALIRAGADIQAKDEQGVTPLHISFLPDYFGRLSKELVLCYSDLV